MTLADKIHYQAVGLSQAARVEDVPCPACGDQVVVGTDWRSCICWTCDHEFSIPRLQTPVQIEVISVSTSWLDEFVTACADLDDLRRRLDLI